MSDNKAVWGEEMRVRVRQTLTYHPGDTFPWEAQIRVYLPADRSGYDVSLVRELTSADPRYTICGSILSSKIGLPVILENADCRYTASVEKFGDFDDAIKWLNREAENVINVLSCVYEFNRKQADRLRGVCLAEHIGYFHRLTFQARSDS